MFKRILKFFNLVDRGGDLSITNIALIILLTKLAIMPTLALPDVAAFFVVLLNYGHKRLESNKAIKEQAILANKTIEDLAKELEEVKQSTHDELAKLKDLNVLVAKQAEDTKKVISTQVVQQAFIPRSRRNQE